MALKYSEKILEQVKIIAEECQGHSKAYCSAACPMHTDAIGYVNLIRDNKIEEALVKIREVLFLPGVLGRICDHPCERECKRGKEYNEPLAIAALKRYAADTADKVELWDISKKSPTGKTVAVIGAGPAGAQAAIDLAKEGHAVTIYDSLPVYGGMMRVGIPAYRLPRNIIDFEYSYLEKLGIVFKMNTEVGKDISFEQIRKEYDAVVVAIGAHKPSSIPTKGDDCAHITNALDFLKNASLMSKVPQPCNEVVVIGGGDVAMDCARTALRLGAKLVRLVSLEKQHELPANKHEQKAVLEEGILSYCGHGVLEFLNEDGVVTGVLLRACESVFATDGSFHPIYNEKRLALPADTVVFATGQLVGDITAGTLKQGGGGRYVVDAQTLATSLEGVFAAGDCAGGKIVIEAMAFGRKAAISVNRYLQGESLDADRDFAKEIAFVSKLELPLPENVENLPRRSPREMNVAQRICTFDECDFGFDEASALAEASRCLRCECKKCMEECIMLNDFTPYPGELFTRFLQTGDIEPVLVYSCNMCDQCTLVCPEEYKFAELFGSIRKEMVKANGGDSPMKGHKAINMHQWLGFSKFFTTACKGARK